MLLSQMQLLSGLLSIVSLLLWILLLLMLLLCHLCFTPWLHCRQHLEPSHLSLTLLFVSWLQVDVVRQADLTRVTCMRLPNSVFFQIPDSTLFAIPKFDFFNHREQAWNVSDQMSLLPIDQFACVESISDCVLQCILVPLTEPQCTVLAGSPLLCPSAAAPASGGILAPESSPLPSFLNHSLPLTCNPAGQWHDRPQTGFS